MSSSILERLFKGDILERKGPESCILIARAVLVEIHCLATLRYESHPTREELVAIQILASLRGNSHPSLLNKGFRSQV